MTFTDLSEIKDLVLSDPTYAIPYLENTMRHLEYLQITDHHKHIQQVIQKISTKKIQELCNAINTSLGNVIHSCLMTSILIHVTELNVNITKEELLQRLNGLDLAPIAKNIITPSSTTYYPKQFKGNLYPPQAGILHRMLEIEAARYELNSYSRINIGSLSEIIGFGKTFLCSALLTQGTDESSGIIKYVDPQENPRTINTHLVICNAKTLKEWQANLELYTDLTVMRINSAKTLREFEELFASDRDLPDVILIKDGRVLKKMLVETFVHTVQGSIFGRLVVDDYDILNLDKNITLPNACFYWLVSSTRNFGNNKKSTYQKESEISGGCTIATAEKCVIVTDTMSNVKCIEDYLSQEYAVPNIDYYSTQLSEDIALLPTDQLSSIVEKFLLNNPYPKVDSDIFYRLLRGSVDKPYTGEPIKALFLCDPTEPWDFNIPTITLDNRNWKKFQSSEHQLALADRLSGVNMSYVTHVIVPSHYDLDIMEQFIGRAQRLGRQTNLQVLIIE